MVVVGAGVEVVENQSPQIGAVPWHFGFSGSYVSPFAISSFTLYNEVKNKYNSFVKGGFNEYKMIKWGSQ